jgi:raffinose/stachyose/melibiose transport system permease protein
MKGRLGVRAGVRELIVFAAPALILILVTTDVPFLMNVFYAFRNWNGISKVSRYIGLRNFTELFTDDKGFLTASLFTAKFTVLFVVLVNIMALLLSLILVRTLKSRNLLRAVFYLPNIISTVVVSFIWRFIFGTGFEALGAATGWGVFHLSWLGDARLAFVVLVFVSLWQSTGFYMVVYVAGLISIPRDIQDASTIDGAHGMQKFARVDFPLLMPSVTVCVFFSLISALKVFDLVFVLTSGGPYGSTISVALDIYTEAFRNSRYGYGTAKSLVFFLAILLVTVIQVRFFKSREIEI